MATVQLDYRGLKCPLPTLKLQRAVLTKVVKDGDILEVKADCEAFEGDVKKFCTDQKKILVKFWVDGTTKTAKIQF
ncbi:MAG: sulfurtransferase TusA family protein [Solirubrobacteraceae bacterium]